MVYIDTLFLLECVQNTDLTGVQGLDQCIHVLVNMYLGLASRISNVFFLVSTAGRKIRQKENADDRDSDTAVFSQDKTEKKDKNLNIES